MRCLFIGMSPLGDTQVRSGRRCQLNNHNVCPFSHLTADSLKHQTILLNKQLNNVCSVSKHCCYTGDLSTLFPPHVFPPISHPGITCLHSPHTSLPFSQFNSPCILHHLHRHHLFSTHMPTKLLMKTLECNFQLCNTQLPAKWPVCVYKLYIYKKNVYI